MAAIATTRDLAVSMPAKPSIVRSLSPLDRLVVGVGAAALVFLATLAVLLVRAPAGPITDDARIETIMTRMTTTLAAADRAHFDDVRIAALVDRMADAQRRDLETLAWLLADVEANGAVTDPADR